MVWLTLALVTGFISSIHCVGMCGPIALALPIGRLSMSRQYISIVSYNLGRAFTYAVLGLIVGVIGQSFSFWGIQQALSIIAGLFLILMAFSGFYVPLKFPTFLKGLFNKLLTKKGISSFLFLGMLNGLLPCGVVYIALTAAFGIGVAWQSALFMAFFGLGTLPAMFSITFLRTIPSVQKSLSGKLMPVFSLIMGLLFVVRGLNLGIPFVSPEKISAHAEKTEVKCCRKVRTN